MNRDKPLPLPPDLANWIAGKLEGLKYGVVTLLVQGGKVTQIERTERERLTDKR